MKKAFKAVIDSTAILLKWKEFCQGLGVHEDDIEIIHYKEQETLREKCMKGLYKWRDTKGEKASRKALLRYVRKCKYNDVAGKEPTNYYLTTFVQGIEKSFIVAICWHNFGDTSSRKDGKLII